MFGSCEPRQATNHNFKQQGRSMSSNEFDTTLHYTTDFEIQEISEAEKPSEFEVIRGSFFPVLTNDAILRTKHQPQRVDLAAAS